MTSHQESLGVTAPLSYWKVATGLTLRLQVPDIFEQLLCRKFSWFYFRLAFSTHCAYSSWGNSCPLALKDSPVDRLLTLDQTVGHHKCK